MNRRLATLALALLSLTACTRTLPALYAPQSASTLKGSASVGKVRYLAHERDGFDADQLDDSTAGDVKLSKPVADFVRGAIVSELRAVGVQVSDNAPNVVRADVESFEVGTAGFSVEWHVTMRLGIERRSDSQLLYAAMFEGRLDGASSEPSDMTNCAAAVVAQALLEFLQQEEVRRLLS